MRLLFFLILLISSSVALSQSPSFVRDSMDAYIQRGLRNWDLPGLAVVIVKDGKVAFMKGYGVKNIKSTARVDEKTLFMIASNTKLFTGTALAMLEMQNKLSLNDQIIKYFPDFRLYDTVSNLEVN